MSDRKDKLDNEGTPTVAYDVRSVYFNGFNVGYSLSDMSSLLTLDGSPQAELKMSFTTAKTFAKALNEAIAEFEKRTSHEVMTMDYIHERIGSNANEK